MATITGTVAAKEDVAVRDYKIWHVIGASAAGTVIEWYDFYIFGSLAAIVAPKFYPAGNEALALIAYLSTFASASSCVRSARSSSDASVTSSAASTPSS
jgi:hypothetical protein